jgi:hypothetical protein
VLEVGACASSVDAAAIIVPMTVVTTMLRM